jgi:hypothetical protein
MTFNPNDPTSSGMVLTFDDEFNSASISSDSVANATLWNNHMWYEGPNPNGYSVANGVATLQDIGLSTVNSAGQGFGQTYGYFEADMKVPGVVGSWPAFWLMSQAHAQNGANPASEIDVIEGQGSVPNQYFTTLHYMTGSGQDAYNPVPNWTADLGVNISQAYHRYGVLWSPDSNQLTFYFDGKPVATATKYSTTDYSPDMMIVGTNEGDMGIGTNQPNASTGHPPVLVDYVRAYQFTSQNPTAVVAQMDSPAAGQTDPTTLMSAGGSHTGAGGGSAGTGTVHGLSVSADGTVVTDQSGQIVSDAHNAFAINAAGQITENGNVMFATAHVTELTYLNHTLYQEATSQNLWWSYNEASNVWTQTGNPLSATPPSPTPSLAPVMAQPTYMDGFHSLYLFDAATATGTHIAGFNPAADVLDLVPLLKADGYAGSNPVADHVVTLADNGAGGTAVMIDPTGHDPNHGATLVTLDHVLPQNVAAASIWH